MNREIRFRVWAEDHMVYLTPAGLQYFDFEGSYALSFVVDGYSGFWGHEQYEKCSELAATFPVMEFTGLKDVTGVDIYPGDILTFCDDDPKFNYPCFVVEWTQNGFYAGIGLDKDKNLFAHPFRFKECKVLGNIHANPEMLKYHERPKV